MVEEKKDNNVLIRREIVGKVVVKKTFYESVNNAKSGGMRQLNSNVENFRSTTTDSEFYEIQGDLKTEKSEHTKEFEVIEKIWNEITEEMTRKKLATASKYTKVVCNDYHLEESNYDYVREIEIRRPIKGDCYIIRDNQGRHLIERSKKEPFTEREIVGTIRILGNRKTLDTELENDGLVEEWVGKDGIVRRREILGSLEVYTKEDGQMGLRENFSESNDTSTHQPNIKAQNSKVIHGLIKAFGDNKRVMIDEYEDENGRIVRREISGVLAEEMVMDLGFRFGKGDKDGKVIVEKIIDDEGNQKFVPIKGTIKIITSNKRHSRENIN